MSKLKQILNKIEEIKNIQKEALQKLSDIDDLIMDIEEIFDLGLKAGDLVSVLKLARGTVGVLELAKEFAEEEES